MRKIIFILIALATSVSMSAKKKSETKVPTESDMGAYVMVYHKDCDHGLHMAVSYDSYNWTSLNDDKPVIAGDTISVQHGIRDPHIFRGPDGGFYLAMTDLNIFAQREAADRAGWTEAPAYRTTEWERDGRLYGFSSLTCPTGVTDIHGNPVPWSEVGCVWAPETVYDYEAGHLLVHFTVRMKNGVNMIYYVYMNDDFTAMISEPKLLFEAPHNGNGVPRYNVIDSDIIKVGDTYNLFYVSHENTATVKHATSKIITGPYVLDDLYNDGERQGHEAPNCWKRLGQDKWVVMFDNYSRRPHNFGFVETTDFKTFNMIGYFDSEGSPMKRANFSEQKHAAVAPLTVKEAKELEKFWKKKK